jgi:hypothetical protein
MIKGYDTNASYQRSAVPQHNHLAEELASWDVAQRHLGNEKHYPDFLAFFQREIERLGGWQQALNEHLFKAGDPRAEDLLARMFAGFLHPLIQLMYGVEWAQPAIVAEALAEASVHQNPLGGFLAAAEKASLDVTGPMPPVLDLVAAAETTRLCARVRVAAEELEERTAEMFQATVYVAAAAAAHPPKEPKFDFFLM